MVIKAAASSSSFKPSEPIILPPSFDDFHPSKLGFTPETLGQRLSFGPTIDRYISFEKLCYHIVSIIYDQWESQPNKVILYRANSLLILDCWDCGLPKGEKYHTATSAIQKQSWVHQILEALVKNDYILSFKSDEGNIWIEKNKRVIRNPFFGNPKKISPYEDSDVQKSDAPLQTSGKGKDIPLSPPSYFKDIAPGQLGFTQETLDQIVSVGDDRYVRFEALCEILLPVIRKQFCVFENTIILDETNADIILKSLDYGLPNGEKYQTATPENKKQSWVYQILEALEKTHYILSFEITKKYIRIEKSQRAPQIIPAFSLRKPTPTTSAPEVRPPLSFHNPTAPIARPSFKYIATSKLGFTPETLEQTQRALRFEEFCNRLLTVVRTAFKWRYDNTVFLDSSNSENIFHWLDCGLPSGQKYHTATPEIQQQSWVYIIFKSLQKSRYIRGFQISEREGSPQIRVEF